MSQLLGSNFKKTIIEQIKKCTRSITIISPYVTMPAVEEIAKSIPDSVKKRCLITVPPGIDYVNGSVDVEALDKLSQIGFEIRCLPKLHAKIYLLDGKHAFVGSANFTTYGWELSTSAVKGNVEDMIRIVIKEGDLDHINSRYIVRSNTLSLDGDWRIDVEKYKSQFQKQYQKLITSIVINFQPDEFAMFSDYRHPPNGYKCYFQFTLAKTTGDKIKKEKRDILLKLGGEKETPHATLNIPFNKFGKYLSNKYSTEKQKNWQFRIYLDHLQNITLKIKDVIINIPFKELKGVLGVEHPR